MEHVIKVRDKFITIIENRDIIAENVGTDTLRIDFDDEWDSMDAIYIVFNDTVRTRRVLYTDKAVEIPWECIFNPGYLYITIVGYIEKKRLAVTKVMGHPFRIRKSGDMCGCDRPDDYPNLDDYNEMVEIVTNRVLKEIEDQLGGGTGGCDCDIEKIVEMVTERVIDRILSGGGDINTDEIVNTITAKVLAELDGTVVEYIDIGDGLVVDSNQKVSVNFINNDDFINSLVEGE